jgi:hypothetical protein
MRGLERRLYCFREHLARAAQQRIAGGVAKLIVHAFQAVQVGHDDRDRPRTFAFEPVQFVDIERTVAQFRQHVMLAEEFRLF